MRLLLKAATTTKVVPRVEEKKDNPFLLLQVPQEQLERIMRAQQRTNEGYLPELYKQEEDGEMEKSVQTLMDYLEESGGSIRLWNGLPLFIEVKAGQVRDIPGYSKLMSADYGYFIGIPSMEPGDALDVFVEPASYDKPTPEKVHVAYMLNKEGNLDEEKVFLGFDSEEEVIASFSFHYNRDMLGFVVAEDTKDFIESIKVRVVQGNKVKEKPGLLNTEERWGPESEDTTDTAQALSMTELYQNEEEQGLRTFLVKGLATKQTPKEGWSVESMLRPLESTPREEGFTHEQRVKIHGELASLGVRVVSDQKKRGGTVSSFVAKSLGIGTITSGQDGVFYLSLKGSSGTAGVVDVVEDTPRKAFIAASSIAAMLKAEGLWDSPRYKVSSKLPSVEKDRINSAWDEAAEEILKKFKGLDERVELSKTASKDLLASNPFWKNSFWEAPVIRKG